MCAANCADDVTPGQRDRGGISGRHDHRLPEGPLHAAAGGTGTAEPRDAYTGSMGYLGLDGYARPEHPDPNDLTVEGGAIEFRTGAGIVADSSPAAELEETRAKARGLLRALGSDD